MSNSSTHNTLNHIMSIHSTAHTCKTSSCRRGEGFTCAASIADANCVSSNCLHGFDACRYLSLLLLTAYANGLQPATTSLVYCKKAKTASGAPDSAYLEWLEGAKQSSLLGNLHLMRGIKVRSSAGEMLAVPCCLAEICACESSVRGLGCPCSMWPGVSGISMSPADILIYLRTRAHNTQHGSIYGKL